jgi:spore coat protein CotH
MIHGEPPLDELLDEPIIGLIAQSDGVSLDELRTLVEQIREWLTRGPAST